MVDETEAMVWMVGAALGITVALFARSFWLPGLLIGLFLLVVGLLAELGMMPVIDPHLNVNVENAEALFVLGQWRSLLRWQGPIFCGSERHPRNKKASMCCPRSIAKFSSTRPKSQAGKISLHSTSM
jgi:hypothetical protein